MRAYFNILFTVFLNVCFSHHKCEKPKILQQKKTKTLAAINFKNRKKQHTEHMDVKCNKKMMKNKTNTLIIYIKKNKKNIEES